MNKHNTVDQIKKLGERKIDKNLWKKTKKLANGNTEEKISAVKLLFKEHYSLPKECIQIAIKLAAEHQPLNVRTEIAKNLMKYQNIPYRMYADISQILVESDNSDILNIIKNSSEFKLHKDFKADLAALNLQVRRLLKPVAVSMTMNSRIQEIMKSVDWNKFRKMQFSAMLNVLSFSKDDRITAILGQVLTEYWLDRLVKIKFHNSEKISKFGFNKKREILHGLNVLKPTTNNDLNRLNKIRDKYAHDFAVKDNEILDCLEKMNCYKQMKFNKKSKNNDRIKKCAIKLVKDLMDVENELLLKKIPNNA